MIELEVQVLSDRRAGLLVELGHVVVTHGFTLVRQRLSQDSRGAWLVMVVRGPVERQLDLEEALATHQCVLSFESSLAGLGGAPLAPPAPVTMAASPGSRPSPTAPGADPDVRQVEIVLPQLAHDYPRIYPWLMTLEHAVAADARESSLHLAGRRTGAWVYKRDYAMGAKLALADALKRIVVPAMRELASVDLRGMQVLVKDSPLCSPGGHSGCRFYGGYLEGLLGASVAPENIVVRNLHCRSTGAGVCVMEITS